jgi:hypothetical protein
VIAVGTGGHEIIGVEDRDGIGFQLFGKPSTIFYEQLVVNRCISHCDFSSSWTGGDMGKMMIQYIPYCRFVKRPFGL